MRSILQNGKSLSFTCNPNICFTKIFSCYMQIEKVRMMLQQFSEGGGGEDSAPQQHVVSHTFAEISNVKGILMHMRTEISYDISWLRNRKVKFNDIFSTQKILRKITRMV